MSINANWAYYDVSPIQYVKFSHRSILREARNILNAVGMVLVLNDSLEFVGIITPRDANRQSVEDASELGDICNRNAFVLKIGALTDDPFKIAPEYVKHIPIITEQGKVVRLIAKNKPGKLVPWRQLVIDLVDRCQLRCPCCTRGTREIPNTGAQMDLALLERIVSKAKGEKIDSIGIYNWTEPLLCKNLHEYLRIINDAGITSHFSSNFSFPSINKLEAIVEQTAGIIVSISGFSQSIYEKYHKGGNLNYVKENLTKAAELIGKKGGWLNLKYLFFDYNQHEMPLARNFAESLGINFTPMCGHGRPLENSESKPRHTEQETAGFYLSKYSPADSLAFLKRTCCQADNFALDCNGDMYLCCVVPTHGIFKLGSYLERPLDEFRLMRQMHPFCSMCEYGGRINVPIPEEDRLIVIRSEFSQNFVQSPENFGIAGGHSN